MSEGPAFPIIPLGGLIYAKRSFAEKREIVRARQAHQREHEELTAAGYRRHETDWEIHRGGRYREVILDAKISHCGKYVWTKIGPKPGGD